MIQYMFSVLNASVSRSVSTYICGGRQLTCDCLSFVMYSELDVLLCSDEMFGCSTWRL
jgi:hypothetical protein